MKPQRESESRRLNRTHKEWLARRGLPTNNGFNNWDVPRHGKVTDDKTNDGTNRTTSAT